MTASISLAYGAMRASIILHSIIVCNLLKSPMEFFDTTPVGRILARISSDISTVDNTLPANFRQVVPNFCRVCFRFVFFIRKTCLALRFSLSFVLFFMAFK